MEMQKKKYIYIQLKNIYTVYVIRHVKKVVIYIWWLDDFQQCWNSSCTIQKYDIQWNGIFLDNILVKWLHV